MEIIVCVRLLKFDVLFYFLLFFFCHTCQIDHHDFTFITTPHLSIVYHFVTRKIFVFVIQISLLSQNSIVVFVDGTYLSVSYYYVSLSLSLHFIQKIAFISALLTSLKRTFLMMV